MYSAVLVKMEDHRRALNRNGAANELTTRYSPLTASPSGDEPCRHIPALTVGAMSCIFGICIAVEAALLSTGVVLPDDNSTFILNLGSAVSIFSCALVVFNYSAVVSSRRHPSPIIFFRTLVNGGYAAAIFVFTLKRLIWGHPVDCASATGAFESMFVQFTGILHLLSLHSHTYLARKFTPSGSGVLAGWKTGVGCSYGIRGLVSGAHH